MKTFKKAITYSASLLLGASMLTSCSDFLTEQSQDLAKVQSWRDLDEVLLGSGYMHSARLISIYGSVPTLDGASGFDILHFMTDEIAMNEYIDYNDYCGYKYSMFPYYTWQQDTGTDYLLKYVGGDDTFWNEMYEHINVCNMVIYMMDELPDDDLQNKERVWGEAYFLRGMYYFFLANFYAKPYDPATASSTPGVPVKLSAIVEDIEYDRGTLAETYTQIISDFEEAKRLLEGKTARSKYHADYTSALLMLSRTYLYMQDWDKAIDYANLVLAENSNLLNVATVNQGNSYVSISSPETIFSMGHYLIAGNFATDSWGDNDPFFYVSQDMRDLFTEDDLRTDRYIGETEPEGYEHAFLKYNMQYKNFGGYSDVSSYCLLRTPEAYLIKAEAQAYKGLDSDACATLKPYLATRMITNPTESLSGNALIDFIREERAREFLLEGHRWFDLRRYTVCQPYKWSKVIEHEYMYYNTSDYTKDLDYIDLYKLEEYDDAYTLPIPRSIRQFQASLGNNSRPVRQGKRTVM